MPYPSPITYPSPALYPSLTTSDTDPTWIGIGSNLVLGSIDVNGVRFTIERFEGWGSPASSLRFSQRARSHGATASEPFMLHKVMTIQGLIIVPTPTMLEAAEDSLAAAVTLEKFQMLVSKQGTVRNVSVQRQDVIQFTELTDRIARYSIQVAAKDPLKYGDLVSYTTLLPSSSGGRTYPATYPITYTGVSNTGVVRVNNAGNAKAPVWLRIDGPVPAGGWTVTHVGQQRSLAAASYPAMNAGDFLTVDMDRKEILAQNQSPRAGYVTTRGWFSLDPGPNDIAFSAANYSSTAQLTITTKPAWS